MLNQLNYLKFILICSLFIQNCAHFTTFPNQNKKGINHLVKKGETIWSIANLYKVSAEEIVRTNDFHKIKDLKAGDTIFIPGVKKKLAPLLSHDILPKLKDEENFIFPVKGIIVSYFELRNGRMHQGIDIKAPEGTEIKAISDGTVIYSSNSFRGYGNIVIIKHQDNFHSVYAHNKENLVKIGQKVTKGQVIALVGNTGNADCFHLHFELRNKGKPMDPLKFCF
ncbi:peptidoglycan DD-metalloendopeptidase family protein [bacterium]|nr:peptidoglycan DD-metalloendopeptidase family protein [bacterium]MBU0899944.1 peptidoglycan DD-metalloendopeptidase family protein [bacterium]MBU1153149.1 peptidoglycan DD-metalloendopeptidase family protein [bacterium]